MNSLDEMVRKVTLRHHNEIKTFCKPLDDYFGVNCFTYSKVLNSGNYYCIGSNPGWVEYYFSEKLYLNQPHWRHPRNFQNGVSLTKHLLSEEYLPIKQAASEKFNVHFSVAIFNHVDDGLEVIGLEAKTPSPLHDTLILNELPLIHRFINKFKDDNKPLFNILEDNQVNIEALIGEKFQVADTPVMTQMSHRKQFLKDLGINLPDSLSAREDEVLKQLLYGNTSSQIASTLKLSCRTIEHYIEKIKTKLGCYSKSELIKKARELELFGYFIPQVDR